MVTLARALGCVVAFVLAAVAHGAGVASAGSVSLRGAGGGGDGSVGEGGASHGWIVATDGRPSLNVSVLHVPPRAGGVAGGVRAAEDGTVRSAAALTDMPLGVAAVGDSLYLAFHGLRSRPTQHRVVSVRAVPVGSGALWATMPRGRMSEEPVLDVPGRLAGLAGTGIGVAALVVEEDRPTLMMLGVGAGSGGWNGTWKRVELPKEIVEWRAGPVAEPVDGAGEGGGAPVVGRPRGVPWFGAEWRVVGGSRWMGILAWRGGDEWTLWRSTFGEVGSAGGDGAGVDGGHLGNWVRVDVSLRGTALEGLANGATVQGSRVQFGVVDGELVAMGLVGAEGGDRGKGDAAAGEGSVRGSGGGSGGGSAGGSEGGERAAHPKFDAAIVGRRVDTAAAWRPLARIEGVTDIATLAAMEGVGRVVVFWEEKPPATRGEGERRRTLGPPEWRLAEMSAASGEVFYEGKLRLPMATATSDYRALGLTMLVVLVGAVLFVIVPIRTQDLVLPEGTALASPGRRLVATAVDGFLALLAASVIWGVPLTQVFGVESVLSGRVIEIMATALAIAIPVSALLEAMVGRSPGKALVGIEVVRMSRGEAAFAGLIVRPSLGMCLVRSAIKWIMPPVAMLGLLDPELRHRGDVLTRAAVVVRFEKEGEEGEDRN